MYRYNTIQYNIIQYNTIQYIAINSFRIFKSFTTQRRSRHNTDTLPEFHAEASQATVSEVLAQRPYVAARAGVEPMTLRTRGVDSTNAPPAPHDVIIAT